MVHIRPVPVGRRVPQLPLWILCGPACLRAVPCLPCRDKPERGPPAKFSAFPHSPSASFRTRRPQSCTRTLVLVLVPVPAVLASRCHRPRSTEQTASLRPPSRTGQAVTLHDDDDGWAPNALISALASTAVRPPYQTSSTTGAGSAAATCVVQWLWQWFEIAKLLSRPDAGTPSGADRWLHGRLPLASSEPLLPRSVLIC